MIVEKHAFSLPDYTTIDGRTIPQVRVGYESYGALNAARDNGILVCHYFSGNSHCAGQYTAADPLPGYWDHVIGPGKAIDTDRYFVLSSDTLCNVGAKNPRVITTGPATIDPRSGKPYGMRFPPVTVRDFVRVQKALADHMGIRRFRAVVGPSFGSAQALEWGAQYPHMVDRIVAVVSPGLRAPAFLVATVRRQAEAVLSDPDWKGGDYYGGPEPVRGLRQALAQLTLLNQGPESFDQTFARRWARSDADPLRSWDHPYLVDAALDKICAERLTEVDANSFLYWLKAVETYAVDERGGTVAALRQPILFIPSRSDQLLHPGYSEKAVQELRAQGTPVEVFRLDSGAGHMAGLVDFDSALPVLKEFIDRPATP